MRKICLVIFALYSCVTIGAEDKQKLVQISRDLDEHCRTSFKYSFIEFEKDQQASFQSLAFSEIQRSTGPYVKTTEMKSKFCLTMFGREYGKVQFSSRPKGASIKFGSTIERSKSDALLNFEVGEYDYKIFLKGFKGQTGCSGRIKVKSRKTKNLFCLLEKVR